MTTTRPTDSSFAASAAAAIASTSSSSEGPSSHCRSSIKSRKPPWRARSRTARWKDSESARCGGPNGPVASAPGSSRRSERRWFHQRALASSKTWAALAARGQMLDQRVQGEVGRLEVGATP